MSARFTYRLVVVLMFLWSNGVYSADVQGPRFAVKVEVSVEDGDENFKNLVQSYLNRELRSLNDVELVETNPEWELHVIALETKYTNGDKDGGVVLSVVLLHQWRNGNDTEQEDLHRKAFATHWLRTGPLESLQGHCKGVVISFDTKYLEVFRKAAR